MIVASEWHRAQTSLVPWVILGAGYTGGMLATRLVEEGHEVIVTRRTAANAHAAALALASPRAHGIAVDLDEPSTLAALPADATIVCTAPPGADPSTTRALRGRRIIYLSSTAVYGPGHGAWVDESWPIAPITAAGRARAAAEASVPPHAAVLRVAGIHGPGRGLLERIRAGTYRIVGDGSAHISRIHIADLVEAIVRAGSCDIAGPINIADDDPAPIGDVADAIAAHLGVPPPPRVSIDSVDPELAGMLLADRRIANRRMKEALGVTLRYPSWRALVDGDA